MRQFVEALNIVHAPSSHGVVTISCGVAIGVPEEGMHKEVLLHRADEALYLAKEQGRNATRVYGE